MPQPDRADYDTDRDLERQMRVWAHRDHEAPSWLVDWDQAFNSEPVEAIVDGLLIPGRWTALVAPAKVGKSTLALHVAQMLSRGLEPFTGGTRTDSRSCQILYLDGEMGQLDVIERLRALGLSAGDLTWLEYSDNPPKGDTLQGGTAIVSAALMYGAELVVLDGLNAFITGAEKDDAPWRALYEYTIAPLKSYGVAVLSSDNTGKDVGLSARGSSVKLDKADVIFELKRTDDGTKLKRTHTRTTAFVSEMDLTMTGADGETPITYRESAYSWPAGTAATARLLDSLGLPASTGRPTAEAALKEAGQGVRTEVLNAAIRYRKSSGTHTGTPLSEQVTEHL